MTPLTPARRAALEWVRAACLAHPRDPGSVLRPDGRTLAALDACAPKRKPGRSDDVGWALRSTLDWLRGTFPAPMPATLREIDAALDGPQSGGISPDALPVLVQNHPDDAPRRAYVSRASWQAGRALLRPLMADGTSARDAWERRGRRGPEPVHIRRTNIVWTPKP